MLQSFTWQQFLVAALVFSAIWYFVMLLIYYRRKLKQLLSRRNRPESLPHSWVADLSDDLTEEYPDVMGKPAEPEGVSTCSMSDFRFASGLDKEEIGNKQEQLGLMPDVLEELKIIFRILEKENGDKENFFSLFALTTSKYPGVREVSNRQALNDYIRENLPFTITNEDLEKLWA